MVKVTARRKNRFEPFLRGTKTFKWASERRYSAFVSVAVLPLGLVPEMTYFNHGLLSFRFWSGCITRWATASEVDLAIICDDERRGLVLELKAFTAPADPREVCERSEEIEKGISQIRTRKAAFAAAPQFLFDALGIDDETTKNRGARRNRR